jgi:hypothetical protein
MWVKCYFKDVFYARMTSRKYDVEEHSAPNSTLYKFVEQYDKLQYI